MSTSVRSDDAISETETLESFRDTWKSLIQFVCSVRRKTTSSLSGVYNKKADLKPQLDNCYHVITSVCEDVSLRVESFINDNADAEERALRNDGLLWKYENQCLQKILVILSHMLDPEAAANEFTEDVICSKEAGINLTNINHNNSVAGQSATSFRRTETLEFFASILDKLKSCDSFQTVYPDVKTQAKTYDSNQNPSIDSASQQQAAPSEDHRCRICEKNSKRPVVDTKDVGVGTREYSLCSEEYSVPADHLKEVISLLSKSKQQDSKQTSQNRSSAPDNQPHIVSTQSLQDRSPIPQSQFKINAHSNSIGKQPKIQPLVPVGNISNQWINSVEGGLPIHGDKGCKVPHNTLPKDGSLRLRGSDTAAVLGVTSKVNTWPLNINSQLKNQPIRDIDLDTYEGFADDLEFSQYVERMRTYNTRQKHQLSAGSSTQVTWSGGRPSLCTNMDARLPDNTQKQEMLAFPSCLDKHDSISSQESHSSSDWQPVLGLPNIIQGRDFRGAEPWQYDLTAPASVWLPTGQPLSWETNYSHAHGHHSNSTTTTQNSRVKSFSLPLHHKYSGSNP